MDQNNEIRLSVVLATYNEAVNLPRCLESVKDIANEIVVVDGESTDTTVTIARQFGATVISTTNKAMFHTNKQMAIDAARGLWILQLDADEVVDSKLRQAIIQVLTQPTQVAGYWLKRKNYFLGTFLTKGGQYPDKVIRLFKRTLGRLPQKSVHEQIVINGDVGDLQGHLLHFNAPTFARYITNANRYTSLTAQAMHENGITMSRRHDLVYLWIKPALTFIIIYFRHRGYRDGFPGLVFALFSGMHWALSYMKLGDIYAGRD